MKFVVQAVEGWGERLVEFAYVGWRELLLEQIAGVHLLAGFHNHLPVARGDGGHEGHHPALDRPHFLDERVFQLGRERRFLDSPMAA